MADQKDYKKILDRLKKQSSKGGGGDRTYMDLTDGKNVCRVLPGHPNMDGFFEEVYYHRKSAGKKSYTVICLNHGDNRADDCLICRDRLADLRESKDKKDKDLYKQQRPKPRFYMNVIDRSDDELKTLGQGIMVMKGILAYVTDEEYGDVLDLTEGRDLTIVREGEDLDTEYTVKAKPNPSPVFDDPKAIKALIGTSAENTKLSDLTELKAQFADEPEKALLVWDEGWDALKDEEDKDEDEDDKKSKKPAPKKSVKKAVDEDEEAEEEIEEEAEEDIFADAPALKSRCSVCGDKRFKTSKGNVCKNKHFNVPQLAEGERPSKPSKAYLKEFPAPTEEEEEQEEVPAPKAKSGKPVAKKPAAEPDSDEDEDLADLDSILQQHSKKKK